MSETKHSVMAIHVVAAIAAGISQLLWKNLVLSVLIGFAALILAWGLVWLLTEGDGAPHFSDLSDFSWLWWF